MAMERRGGQDVPLPQQIRISEHAEERMLERGVIAYDLFEILLNSPYLRWDDEERDRSSTTTAATRRLRMTGRGLQPRLLTVILEPPDEDGMSVVVTVFDADPADQRRYRAFRRRRAT